MFLGILDLYLGSKILGFFVKFKDLLHVLGSNLHLAALSLSFFLHSQAIVWEIREIDRT